MPEPSTAFDQLITFLPNLTWTNVRGLIPSSNTHPMLQPFCTTASPGISLSVPTTNVVASTSVDCEWNVTPSDPATFSLVMQFSDLGTDFGETALVTTVRRGNATSGTVGKIINVGTQAISMLHSAVLGVAVVPGRPTLNQFRRYSNEIRFLYVRGPPSNVTTGIPRRYYRSTFATNTGGPTSTPTSTSPSRGINRTPALLIAIATLCAVLVLGFLGTEIILLRRRKARTLYRDGDSLLASRWDINGTKSAGEGGGSALNHRGA
ncbi:hypothetical protein DFH09DRAFT_1337356 [Mycena vulgaris]|nr:hypothetical protein DFH09DRAFT_1337356 [Mycena vulgaris]